MTPSLSLSGRRPAVRVSVAALMCGAAAIHFAVAREHYLEFAPFGVFFVVAGVAQVALAGAVLALPAGRVALVGAAATVGLPALWALSRTVGVPVGPHPWQAEQVGVPDAICVGMELVSAPGRQFSASC